MTKRIDRINLENENKETLILKWKQLRSEFFNLLDEDMEKFEKLHGRHPLYDSVVKHFDKNFKEINQIVESEINELLKNKAANQ